MIKLYCSLSYSIMMKARRSRILDYASSIGCDTVVAFQPENVYYLTGFWGEAIALCTNLGTKLITPKLEVTRALRTAKESDVITSERGAKMISTLALQIKEGTSCSDCDNYSEIQCIQKSTAHRSFLINPEPFYQSRMIKDNDEIKAISNAARIIDTLYEICTQEIRVGMSERELQALLIFEAMKRGANTTSYKSTLNPLIIAGGSNAAEPHAEISDRRFLNGDFIVVDLTLRFDGYIADATRTFALGTANNEMKKVYNIVKESQQAGLDALKEGVECSYIDAVCRQLIENGGYSNEFIHSTGHGIGLEVHEPPWLTMKNPEILQPNMAVTIEPGIYLDGKFGVRIEDSTIIDVKNSRVRNLNEFSKDLIVLG